MDRFFFDHETFHRLYNCSFRSHEEWSTYGKSNVPLGIVYLMAGATYEVLYIPFLFVMASSNFFRLSCYKIMFYLGVVDIITIVDNSLLSGYFSLTGAIYCTHPTVMYVSGSCAVGLWCCACMTCMILAINRCLDLLRPTWMKHLFAGWRTYLWLLMPTVYGLYFAGFTPPLIFTSIYDANFFDPFVGTRGDDSHGQAQYTNWPHTINNIVVIVVLVTAYTGLCSFAVSKGKLSDSANISVVQRQIILQASMICTLILIAASVYVYMQFFPIPAYLVVLGQFTWQGSHGGAVFIYIFLNPTMRKAVARRFLPRFMNGNPSGVNTTTAQPWQQPATKAPIPTIALH